MTRQEFRARIERKEPMLLDGASGTEFQKLGMPIGVCPEKWVLDNAQAVTQLQRKYVEAGSDIIYAPTFGANRFKLGDYGLEDQVYQMNMDLVAISKEATQGKALVAGNLSPTGEQIFPLGEKHFEEFVETYKEQVQALVEGGVDLFVIETMMSLQEARAALIAIKETCDLPVMVSLTYDETGVTLYGTDPLTALITLQNLGADAVGINCSTGPEKMIPLVVQMKPHSKVPIFIKPNAGLPKMVDGQSVYDMKSDNFAAYCKDLIKVGANIIGGCCGTTPDYIKQLKQELSKFTTILPNNVQGRCITSERKTVVIELDQETRIVGERINPTGKKQLQAELKEDNLDEVTRFALEQVEKGASILDVNVGMNGIDEKDMMVKVIGHLSTLVDVPLCIDSSHVDVIESALRVYPGRALVNSISLEEVKIKELMPVVAKYGAMFVLLPLSDQGLPKSIDEKKEIINKVLKEGAQYDFQVEDVVVDGLVTTVATNALAAKETLEVIRYCKDELNIATIVGLSNISFGLPNRKYLNSTFLTMAIASGLTMAIANPSSELLMMSALASDVLQNKDEGSMHYISKASVQNQEQKNVSTEEKKTKENNVFEAVVKGNKKNIVHLIQEELDKETQPKTIVDKHLIPAINKVGELFDKQIYFLPQLIVSAETMKIGIEYLEPMLKAGDGDKDEKKPVVVMATVEGDIHDIGKNLVVLMLKNYGFNVFDLGKDVSCDEIIKVAKENDADIIGLSALMTTTMMQMKKVIKAVEDEGLKAKVVIGGAVITESFAQEIGAHGYSKDAADAVALVSRLMNQ
ncbi:5-methyltetrahydrofolate--homocysteine methyltransferase [Natranaerovirga hydrolytica]|uniref:Methionine synthase n=1 Tax=Natranaerovirga hydrolytica TaxID=680378 RepID=A0A4R1MZ51_9FIRM|nr:homocysteine S-methyltransferase family protein [Natranaerovirga hydrolytica]TCK98445.1 5-methyltetrahydrofolate--homocysteine methyltransferase [Natranaerovirga hydrolytica]